MPPSKHAGGALASQQAIDDPGKAEALFCMQGDQAPGGAGTERLLNSYNDSFSKSKRSSEVRGLGQGEGLPSWTPDSGMVVTMAAGDLGNQLQCWQLRGPRSKTGLRLKCHRGSHPSRHDCLQSQSHQAIPHLGKGWPLEGLLPQPGWQAQRPGLF